MKKVDSLLLKAYWLPFLAGFAIILFVLVNQYLYWFLQAFAGKGLSLIYLGKLFWHAAGKLVVIALPVAIMVGALITFGNLSENNELLAIKSSGIGFMRLLFPFLLLGIGLVGFSLWQSYYMIPHSNTKLYTLLFDVSRKKADMAIQPGQFYTDIEGYVIRVGSKSENGEYLKDVLLYKHEPHQEKQTTIRADSGKITRGGGNHLMKMVLFSGVQVEDYAYQGQSEEVEDEMGRMYFDSLYAYVPLDGFQLESTKPSAFRHQYLMSQPVLSHVVDSMETKLLASKASSDHRSLEQRQNQMRKRMIPFQFEYYRRTAIPVNCLVFMIIGCALGAYIKKGNLGVAAVAALIALTIFYAIDSQGKTLATHQVISPFYGAWASVGMLSLIAIFLTFRANKE